MYYAKYIDSASGDDLLAALVQVGEETVAVIKHMSEEDGNYAYADGKWSVKQVLQHIVDVERIFCYRALRFARKDVTDLPGFDEDFYADNDGTKDVKLVAILEDYENVNKATVSLFKSFPSNRLDIEALASGVVMTPRILGWSIVGHNTHHLSVINTRYKK